MFPLIFCLLSSFGLISSLNADEPFKPLEEISAESAGTLNIDGKDHQYKAVVGTLVIKDDKGKDRATVSYTGYFLNDNMPAGQRPITFCFNGGPGAGSVWLNLGMLGPKCISTNGLTFLNPPYQVENNPDTLLDVTDLIFIDPLPAGLSSSPPGQDCQSLFSVDEDVKVLSDVVRLLTSKYQRWDSPKFFVGESYGGMRVIKMGSKLHSEGYYLNGLILVSPALDMQTLIFEKGNELPYALFIPSYAATAWYHSRSDANLSDLLVQAESYAVKRYSVALLEGNRLPPANRKEEVKEIAKLTHVSEDCIDRVNLRLKPRRFMRELLRDQCQVTGCFDSRVTGLEDPSSELMAPYDPSLETVFGAMTAAYTNYLLKDLHWPEAKEYKALVPIRTWNWGKANQYATATGELEDLMIQNPHLKVFVATGIYDLAIPYLATDFAISHLELPPSGLARINSKKYPGGHMMYLDPKTRKELREDILSIFK